jgi:ketosteroid isomerase-like protein
MSEENVEIARQVYRHLGRGSDAGWDLFDPDVEWETSPNLPDAGVYRGRDRVRAFMEEQWEVVWGGPPRVDVERTFDCGDDVLLFIRVRGSGSHTGIPLDVRIAQLLTLRDGRVVRGKVFPDRDEALEAAGISD